MCSGFQEIGERLCELMKFFALLVFGALLNPESLDRIPVGGFLVAAVALVARPAGLLISFAGTGLPRRQRWAGPKGLASVVYGLYVVQADLAAGEEVFAFVIALSVLVHTTTDVPIARRLADREDPAE